MELNKESNSILKHFNILLARSSSPQKILLQRVAGGGQRIAFYHRKGFLGRGLSLIHIPNYKLRVAQRVRAGRRYQYLPEWGCLLITPSVTLIP